MAAAIGKHAVVVGAGIAGLTAARAVSDAFERVLILERDTLPSAAVDRSGIPQGKHVHVLLAGGERALAELFPGFRDRLTAGGAVPTRVDVGLRIERPGYDPFPRRDFGWDNHWMSRALMERTVRDSVRALPTVEIRDRCRVEHLVADGSTVRAVQWTNAAGVSETIETDLVIDASSQGLVTLRLLESLELSSPDTTTIGVDLAYSTAVFEIPDDAPADWQGVFCFPPAPRSSRAALLAPLEGRRWILTVAGRGPEKPPRHADGFMAHAKALRTPTIYNAVRGAKRLGEIEHFQFPESRLRHYERLERFPRGLVPIGDAICRFNPIYGQGMSVAAQEAVALRRVLEARRAESDPLDGIAKVFFAEAHLLIDTPWAGAAVPDLIYPDARGQRPANFQELLKFSAALGALAARDPEVHRLTAEVQQLLKPRSVYRDPALVERVMQTMASFAKTP